MLCPRGCGADRRFEAGACGVLSLSRIARFAPHYWEEPCISGERGSGAVFFSGCNLNCVFCQNHRISRVQTGRAVSAGEMADIMLQLQSLEVHNINLVTPTPHIELILEAIPLARARGLTIPCIYNTNGYETVETLKRLEGLIDVYLPDLKYTQETIAHRYSRAKDYFKFAAPAIDEMFRQRGLLRLDQYGIAQEGVIIRHLVLPGSIDETRRVLKYIRSRFPRDICLSLMGQYTPSYHADYPPINRGLLAREYQRAVECCVSLGFTNVYIQDVRSSGSAYIPDFD